ncbi:MAG: GPW/gp25 family protein [Chloroflexota bacterium]|nr:GPW/gp25 family protein [Chloroflexota bacterium]
MVKARFRSWRFQYPTLSKPGDTDPSPVAGLRVHLRGGVDMVEDDDAVRQAILLLLSTRVGERVMRPDYGCMLHRLLFAPNDETTAGLAIYYVQRAIDRWEPRVTVLDIDAERHPEAPHQLDIHLRYRVKPTHQIDTLNFSFNLAGDVG